MQWIAAVLIGGLMSAVQSLIGRALLALGIGVVTYAGVGSLIDGLKAQSLSGFAGLPAELLGILAVLKVGESLSILFGALTIRLTLQGLTSSGTIKRWSNK
jgi:hypothetical protein